jgi:hypothetical protein
MEQQRRKPDLRDMEAAGMGLTESLAFWNEMMNSPDRPIDWWDEMHARVRARRSASGTLQ